jgi:hypothetical protein
MAPPGSIARDAATVHAATDDGQIVPAHATLPPRILSSMEIRDGRRKRRLQPVLTITWRTTV